MLDSIQHSAFPQLAAIVIRQSSRISTLANSPWTLGSLVLPLPRLIRSIIIIMKVITPTTSQTTGSTFLIDSITPSIYPPVYPAFSAAL